MHWWHIVQHWLTVHTGSSNTPSVVPNYNFWSGFGSDIAEVTLIGAVLAALFSWYRRNNCHVEHCKRISHRIVTGLDEHGQPVTYHVCRRHHPADAPSHQDVIDAHQAARGEPQ
jgi:hypothetical protein